MNFAFLYNSDDPSLVGNYCEFLPAQVFAKIFLLGLAGSRNKNSLLAELKHVHNGRVTAPGDNNPGFTNKQVQMLAVGKVENGDVRGRRGAHCLISESPHNNSFSRYELKLL